MLVYRITQSKYAQSLVAAGIYGRWNSEGQKMIYTAGSIALACLENLVHRTGASLNSGNFSIASINIPDHLQIDEIELNTLLRISSSWEKVSNYTITQKLGDQWLQDQRSAILKVPSAIIPLESNYLLNPYHKDFAQVKIENISPYQFDPRLKMQ